MRFHTDSTVQKSGWSVDYQGGSCCGYIKDRSGTIDAYAHSLDGLLPQRTNCTWTIETEHDDKVIRLKEWRAFSIANHPQCDKD